jgi:PAS domain-containing protein
MAFEGLTWLSMLAAQGIIAFLAVFALSAYQRRKSDPTQGVFVEKDAAAEFLFDGVTLIDASATGLSLLPKSRNRDADTWPQLSAFLEKNFSGYNEKIEGLKTDGLLIMTSPEEAAQPLSMRAEYRGGLTRIAITASDSTDFLTGADPLARRALQDELDQLRDTAALLPMPVWRESTGGEVVWANAAYLTLATAQLDPGAEMSWPLPRVFERTASAQSARSQRQKLERGQEPPLWFELTSVESQGDRLVFAQPVEALVQAEASLNAFMQTLTKTFAQLSVGLAIFDHNRKLVLFNPALADLTGLAPDTLTMRPSLDSFFDALRAKSMIPETRDYRGWRSQITNIERQACSGHYEEMWNLLGGQTYRVIGRPHPNGALALSFQDISTEMTQTRRYRADLELGQSVIDAVDGAIAVFSAAGILVMSNAAYAEMWGHDPAGSLGSDGNAALMCDYWRAASVPTTLWDRAEDLISGSVPAQTVLDETRMRDGRRVSCRFSRLPGGSTFVCFQLLEAEDGLPALPFDRKTA